MKKIYFPFFLVLSIASFLTLSSKKTYTYDEIVNNKNTSSTWTVENKKQQLIIVGKSKKNTTTITTNQNYSFQKYQYISSDKKTNYTISKKNGALHCEGIVNGKKQRKTHNIGNTAWIQQFSFGLYPLASSSKKELRFYSVNPKDFSINKLIATKKGTENLYIKDKKYSSQKMLITLPGFKGLFWEAYIWFNAKTHEFLKYKGDEGPNTPTTTILLHIKS